MTASLFTNYNALIVLDFNKHFALIFLFFCYLNNRALLTLVYDH